MNHSDTWQPSKYDLRTIRSLPDVRAEPFIFPGVNDAGN
ncbi:hypothetical protein SynBIOSE41_01405 [Synechococcus sp. BIOS-E4-1]|nr:hypothetical protein SynBIOSE41_01405 [Synechococcus sp. BIOS-E4-1]